MLHLCVRVFQPVKAKILPDSFEGEAENIECLCKWERDFASLLVHASGLQGSRGRLDSAKHPRGQLAHALQGSTTEPSSSRSKVL